MPVLASNPTSAYNQLNALCTELQERYPLIGITFGYIGNIWGPRPQDDDRSWMFFTKIRVSYDNRFSSATGRRYSFGGYKTDQLPELLDKAVDGIETWLRDTVQPHAPKSEAEAEASEAYDAEQRRRRWRDRGY